MSECEGKTLQPIAFSHSHAVILSNHSPFPFLFHAFIRSQFRIVFVVCRCECVHLFNSSFVEHIPRLEMLLGQ